MPKFWKIAPQKSDDPIEQLLISRGLKSKKLQTDFFNSQLDNYSDELELDGLEKAKERISKAIKDKELIIVYGDYDVDGLCSTAVMYHALSFLGAKVLPYIPHREKEGYGLSAIGIDEANEKGAKLILTVDNGIVANTQVEYIKSLGMDVIVTDHHVPSEKLPKTFATVHSSQICGAAVAWCLVRKLLPESESESLLDLVAMATICDMMPLVGINRALVKKGLQILNTNTRVGLLALINECDLKKNTINSFHISHILGPRLNAIGRLEHSIDALRLLCTKETLKAKSLAQKLCLSNDQKKQITQNAIYAAYAMIATENIPSRKIFVLHSQDWIPGIIGLVAGRISEEHHKPAVIISDNGKTAKGSARSSNGLNIIELLRKHEDLLDELGGHPGAAGFTIKSENITLLKERLGVYMEDIEVEENESLEVEMVLSRKQITRKLFDELLNFEPFGMGNPQPVFATNNLKVESKRVLSEGKHLKLTVDGMDAIAFSFGKMGGNIKEGDLINLAYNLDLNYFNGKETLQLKVLDINLN